MSVYIKGMEMPDRCFACPMCDTDCCGVSKGSYIEYRDVDVDVAMDGRPDWCPLIPVPEHGDLKDVSPFDILAWKGIPDGYENTFSDGVQWLAEKLDAAPVVIQADKE